MPVQDLIREKLTEAFAPKVSTSSMNRTGIKAMPATGPAARPISESISWRPRSKERANRAPPDDQYRIVRGARRRRPRARHSCRRAGGTDTNQSAVILAVRMMSPHLARSARIRSANSAGLFPTIRAPDWVVNRSIDG